MRKFREPWKQGPRIDRMSSVTASRYNQRGPPDYGTDRGVHPRHAPRAYSASHPERPMYYHTQGAYLSRREVTAAWAARATPASRLEVREVGPIEATRHEDTVSLPASTVPLTVVVALCTKRAETVTEA